MMKTEDLRKADFFSGSAITLLGLLISGGALQMPMKDSWGGVQNVWYVSPAIFPLFVGTILTLLGLFLVRISIKNVGKEGIKSTLEYLFGKSFILYAFSETTIRFYAILFNLLLFVFVMVPRIDFFPASIMFLLVLFLMFYYSDHSHLISIFKKLAWFSLLLFIVIVNRWDSFLEPIIPYAKDWMVIGFILFLIFHSAKSINNDTDKKRRFRICLIIGITAPFVIGIIFKYFLLVPMPFEGLVVSLLDSIWYAEIWSS
ncbi:membrane hypothetical protein [Desulfamplus magnetovallimortis]|uniref:Uncharacterized protein n=1 Tax=Desulfamplus magnetovallimortis TaxID=1246637 RepID=A0A1W1HKZ3_9BACT|nr:hypothetical protein [Desulfamplus magnetovallimortis]SLM33018.1 membrane hypothetical protein [Desulfamplus magnetovallimortis]